MMTSIRMPTLTYGTLIIFTLLQYNKTGGYVHTAKLNHTWS
jgi:hypothetical protein